MQHFFSEGHFFDEEQDTYQKELERKTFYPLKHRIKKIRHGIVYIEKQNLNFVS